jgi:signal peptidase II
MNDTIIGAGAMARRRIPFVALLILAADQAAKLGVERWLPVDAQRPLWPGLLTLTNSYNLGVAMGWLQETGGVALVSSLAAVLGLLLAWQSLAAYSSRSPAALAAGLSCFLGGAASNTLDRLRLGHVIDFIGLPNGLILNLADLMIVLGVLLIARALWTASEARAARITACAAGEPRSA